MAVVRQKLLCSLRHPREALSTTLIDGRIVRRLDARARGSFVNATIAVKSGQDKNLSELRVCILHTRTMKRACHDFTLQG
jgi:hypothetical protein